MRRVFGSSFRAICCTVAITAALMVPRESSAATISMVGDADCFGLGGTCPDGTGWQTDLGGVFFTSYQGLGDPTFTDKWSSDTSPTYTHSYVLDGTPVAAALEVRTAGLADSRGPWSVFFNGVLVGAFPTNNSANAFQEVLTHSFMVPIALITGNDLVSLAINTPNQGDGYSIDYSRLTIATAAAPEPASLVLLMSGAAVALVRRRKQQAR